MSETPKDQESVGGGQVVTAKNYDRVAAILKLFDRISKDELTPYEHGKTYIFPFWSDEELLSRIDQEVRKATADGGFGDPSFSSTTVFQDLTSVKHEEFNDFIKSAGDKKNPNTASLRWSTFSVDPTGEPSAGNVELHLSTEKQLDTDIQEADPTYKAHITLRVSGTKQDWVHLTFSNVEPFIDTMRLGGIFKPLWFFRNQTVVYAASFFFAFFLMNVADDLYDSLRLSEVYLERSGTLQKILSASTAESKLDELATFWYSGDQPLWYRGYGGTFLNMFGFVFGFALARYVLPALVPASSVAIGLTNRRAKNSQNVFRFIVFTLIIGGLLVPSAMEILKQVFS